jgi:hypothetical protein
MVVWRERKRMSHEWSSVHNRLEFWGSWAERAGAGESSGDLAAHERGPP